MSERGILLSKLEQEMFTNPNAIGKRQQRNLRYRLKTKSDKINQVLQEIKLLVENASEDSIKECVSNTTLDNLMTILEKILQVLDPWPIGVLQEDEWPSREKPYEEELRAFKVWGSIIPSSPPGKCTIDSVSRTATKEEIDLHKRLMQHMNKIRLYVDPCIPDPVCRDPKYTRLLMEKLRLSTQRPFNASFGAYLDEIGVSETGWILREPVSIDISRLRWMRWKPRGLKECIKQPPLLGEKKAPGKWFKMGEISSSSTPEEIEKFNEELKKEQARPKLTKEQLLEINKKYKSLTREVKEVEIST